MTTLKVNIIECDQCGAEARVCGVSKRKARRLIAASGWDLNPGCYADLCPPCSRADEEAS